MRTKIATLKGLKIGPADGLQERQFLAYAATFTRTPDSYGDVIAKGAFVDSIADWRSSGDVMPIMWAHDLNQIHAAAIDMTEDEHGLLIKGEFDDDPAALRVYKLVKGRRATELSFAFDVIDEGGVELDDGRKVNELRKLRIFEASFLPKGYAANPDTSVVAVKAASDIADLRDQVKALADEVASLKDSGATAPVGQDEASAASAPADEGTEGVKSDEASPLASVDALALAAVLELEAAI